MGVSIFWVFFLGCFFNGRMVMGSFSKKFGLDFVRFLEEIRIGVSDLGNTDFVKQPIGSWVEIFGSYFCHSRMKGDFLALVEWPILVEFGGF